MLVAQSYLILCNSMDCSLPGSSVHTILQARTLEWVAIPFSRGSSQTQESNPVSYTEADSLPSEPPGKTLKNPRNKQHDDVTILKSLLSSCYCAKQVRWIISLIPKSL